MFRFFDVVSRNYANSVHWYKASDVSTCSKKVKVLRAYLRLIQSEPSVDFDSYRQYNDPGGKGKSIYQGDTELYQMLLERIKMSILEVSNVDDP